MHNIDFNELRELRKSSGITLRHTAKKIGVNETMLCSFLKGRLQRGDAEELVAKCREVWERR